MIMTDNDDENNSNNINNDVDLLHGNLSNSRLLKAQSQSVYVIIKMQ